MDEMIPCDAAVNAVQRFIAVCDVTASNETVSYSIPKADPHAYAALLALADLLGVGIVEPCIVCKAPPFTSSEVSTYVNCGTCGTTAHTRRPGG